MFSKFKYKNELILSLVIHGLAFLLIFLSKHEKSTVLLNILSYLLQRFHASLKYINLTFLTTDFIFYYSELLWVKAKFQQQLNFIKKK